ncbi:DUF927 domain-containing protein [Aeromonas media]|uniref:DUF927 domain-containing protein n=1 Tax=Aeromonas media TaxID=651 RepID=UPI00370B7BDB
MSKAGFVSDVAAAATGHWPDLLMAVGIDTPRGGKHGPCPTCGGKDRFRLDNKGGRGTWICNQCGAGDGLALVGLVTGKPIKEAAELIAPLVGLSAGGLDAAERERIHQQQKAKVEQEGRQVEQQRHKAARRAAAIMQDCEQAHAPYLALKSLGVCLCAVNRILIREAGENFPPASLIVPLYNEASELVNVQLIRDDGTKRYLAGGQKVEAYHRIDGRALVAVTEGYATGLSVHIATGATVYCAMDGGNLLNVAKIARRQHPTAEIIIGGDHDLNEAGQRNESTQRQTEGAALAVGAVVALPPIQGDWNDYYQAHGLAKTQEAIMSACTTPLANSPQDQDASQKERAPWQTEAVTLHPPQYNRTTEEQVLPPGFEIKGDRLCFWRRVGRGRNAEQELIPISSPVRVLAETSNVHGRGYGRLLEWRDSAGRVRQWAMPVRSLVPRSGEAVFSELLDAGLRFIDMTHKNKLGAYLMACQPERRIISVEHTGWHGSSYVLPNGVIGPDADSVMLQTTEYAGDDFEVNGTLGGWQRGVSAMAVGNSRLCLGLSLAFAAPLLSLFGEAGGGFHLVGDSSNGKSTILECASSVYGHPDRYGKTWRATGNGIEGLASRRNDALLCLDEMKESNPKEAGMVAYMLANGQGKVRSRQDGEITQPKTWRLAFLSTGEVGLDEHAASGGERIYAGMEVRTVHIPSDTGAYGAFERPHGHEYKPDTVEAGRSFSDALKAASRENYGVAFRAFIELIARDMKGYKARLTADIKRLSVELTPEGAGAQVGRAVSRFALVAAAGELATELGITGWHKGEATRAANKCVEAWIIGRGHTGNQEEAATLAQVRKFVTAHQYTRFADWFDANHRPVNMVGYRKAESDGVSFFVLPPGWAEITKGRDPKRAATLCLEAGYLRIGKDKRRLQYKARLPGMSGAVWVYLLTERVMADAAEGQEDE